jgi:glutamyl-tRNA reductase
MSMCQHLVLLGVNHATAPIEVRERLAIPSARLAEATRALVHQQGIREGMILSTCNRVEFLTLQESGPGGHTANLAHFLYEYFAVPPQTLQSHLYEFRETEAIRHLFRVVSSLDSMVLGESQILGQVKESYTVAREVGAVAGPLDALLQRAFTVAKRVRSETEIGSSPVSIASVAVELALKIFGSLAGKTVMIVGAGTMAELAARHLVEHGASNLLLVNRTLARAEALAERFRGPGVRAAALPLDALDAEAHRADIVITATGVQNLFLRADGQRLMHERRGRPIFFIDIAVPRDVDPGLNDVEGCFVYDIDDLQQVAARNLAGRKDKAQTAETIVSREVEKYEQRLQARDAVPAIVALQQNAEAIREVELARAMRRLSELTPEQRKAVETLTRSLTAKLLHPQYAALRDAARARADKSE